ncbi:hypothetical protein [Vreelandella sp. EE27]
MEIENLLGCLGDAVSSRQLNSILQKEGIDLSSDLILPDSEYRTYIERPAKGYSLVFTDEAVFLGITNQPIGKSALYLSGVFLYGEGKDGYTQFNGKLPIGLSFSANQEDIKTMLGNPSWNRKRSDGSVAAERWDNIADYRVHITYTKPTSKPVLISLSKADG